ncbi:MAG: VOC family protein [Anaerolineae bacterium]|nr:VOC family protein [Anaerolineae bacterium]MCB0233507.1 VOC family protein [Anaerolineae bacterium]MCB0247136.1 VOC family protein [Anaerolineae bacterium]MCB9133632.1 VOC family protein [Anaerolineales bacterium]MCB9141164.1 VOC family protein [Anaerolineales bacterium]
MQKITTFLAYDNQAEEAVNLYVSLFPNSRILNKSYYMEGSPMPAGLLMTVQFELAGLEYIAMNGGSYFKFTDGISLSVACESQEEVDFLWEKLSEGGEPGPCGWLKDRFGLSWQINPIVLGQMLGDEDRERAGRVMQAMLKMGKIEIAELQRAYDGE